MGLPGAGTHADVHVFLCVFVGNHEVFMGNDGMVVGEMTKGSWANNQLP